MVCVRINRGSNKFLNKISNAQNIHVFIQKDEIISEIDNPYDMFIINQRNQMINTKSTTRTNAEHLINFASLTLKALQLLNDWKFSSQNGNVSSSVFIDAIIPDVPEYGV